MPKSQGAPGRDLAFHARKYFIAALILASFAGYALHDRQAYADVGGASSTARQTLAPTSAPPTRVIVASASAQLPTVRPIDAAPAPTATFVVVVPRIAGAAATEVAAIASGATPRPTSTLPPRPTSTQTPVPYSGGYKDGTYDGPIAKTVFGPVQVQAVIVKGQIYDVAFLDYPHARRTSVAINSVAAPRLEAEAVQIQNERVH